MRIHWILILGIGLAGWGVAAKPAKRAKSARPPRAVVPREVMLGSDAIYSQARAVAQSGVYSRILQIDLLQALFQHYHDDPRLVQQRREIVIQGTEFAQAYRRAERLFARLEGSGTPFIQPAVPPPEIQYNNFRSLILYACKERTCLSILLDRGYVQEIPYTFGARISLRQDIRAEVRTDDAGTITEAIFENDRAVMFLPPGIAFFVPDVYVRIASVVREEDEVYGYVIGRPRDAPRRHVAIRYNLSTCAKSSIKTFDLTLGDYKRKLRNVDYYDFAY